MHIHAVETVVIITKSAGTFKLVHPGWNGTWVRVMALYGWISQFGITLNDDRII